MQALLFDFDGVVLQTVDLKTAAFADIYAPHGPEVQQRVVAYHRAHGGISRYEKFRVWERELLGKKPTEADIEQLAQQFSNLVYEKVLAAPFVPGAREFLEHWSRRVPCFVCTGTPDAEIQRVIDARGFRPWFREVCGSPRRKPEIIRYLLKKYALDRTGVRFFGDATTDYEAARKTNVPFIGIESDHTDFPPGTVVWQDFTGTIGTNI